MAMYRLESKEDLTGIEFNTVFDFFDFHKDIIVKRGQEPWSSVSNKDSVSVVPSNQLVDDYKYYLDFFKRHPKNKIITRLSENKKYVEVVVNFERRSLLNEFDEIYTNIFDVVDDEINPNCRVEKGQEYYFIHNMYKDSRELYTPIKTSQITRMKRAYFEFLWYEVTPELYEHMKKNKILQHSLLINV